MNSTIQNKNFNLTFFFLSVLVTVALLGGAVYFGSLATGVSADGVTNANQICLAQLKEKGFQPKLEDKEIKVQVARTIGLEEQTLKASVVLATCLGYDLTEFCAGPDCTTPGLTFKLVEKPL